MFEQISGEWGRYIYEGGPWIWFGVPALTGGIIWGVRGFNANPYGGDKNSLWDCILNGWFGFVLGSMSGSVWFLSLPTYFCVTLLENRKNSQVTQK